MTDPNDLRKIETWLRDCKADLWMTEVCEDAADDIERLPAMLKRAFHEGFNFTCEGFNGECAYDHLAPDGLTLEEKSAIVVREILVDHDAKPEARAINGSCGTGNTQKPVAWHFKCDEYESVTLLKQHADAMAEFYKTKAVPLYYAATLTDAEREAKAAEPESSVPLGSGAAPAKQEPVAWMVQNDDGERWLCHNHPAAAKYGLKCFPLFAKPQPTLTDAEREAIAMAASACDMESVLNVACNGRQSFADMWSDRAGVLRSLLERLK